MVEVTKESVFGLHFCGSPYRGWLTKLVYTYGQHGYRRNGRAVMTAVSDTRSPIFRLPFQSVCGRQHPPTGHRLRLHVVWSTGIEYRWTEYRWTKYRWAECQDGAVYCWTEYRRTDSVLSG